MANFIVAFHRDYRSDPMDRVVLGRFNTVEAAAKARTLSGDLVCHARSGEVVTNKLWLFPWERATPSSYAYRLADAGPLHPLP